MPKGSRIVMADDDKMLIDMYKERLELAGYQVTICHNGEEALEKVRETKPEIVLLDVMMPKLNGYEALASIKSDPNTKEIPVIMLSALMRDFNREKAVEAGADDYLIKSEAMPADVITKIEQVLQKYQKGGGTPGAQSPVPQPSNIYVPSAQPPVQAQTEQAPTTVAFTPANPTVVSEATAAPVSAPPVAPQEEVPVVKIDQPQTPLRTPLQTSPQTNTPEPKKSSAGLVTIVVLAVLLTALVTGAIIYFFFINK